MKIKSPTGLTLDAYRPEPEANCIMDTVATVVVLVIVLCTLFILSIAEGK